MFFSPSRRQGRFKPLLVDKDEYLLPLSRYVHLNRSEQVGGLKMLSFRQNQFQRIQEQIDEISNLKI